MPALDPRTKRELIALCLAVLAFVSFLSLFGLAGPGGRSIDSSLAVLLGLTRFLFPLVLAGIAVRLTFPERLQAGPATALGVFLLFIGLGGFLNVTMLSGNEAGLYVDNLGGAGGYTGLLLSYPLVSAIGAWGGGAVLLAMTLIAAMLILNLSLHDLAVKTVGLRYRLQDILTKGGGGGKADDSDGNDEEGGAEEEEDAEGSDFRKRELDGADLPAALSAADERSAEAAALDAAIKKKRSRAIPLPLDLLENQRTKPTSGDIHGRMMVIQKTLENFGIPVEMGEISVGPTVTQFTLKPADGVKLSRITSLSNDLALALAAHPIRIEAPIPGRSLVGIEVPNQAVAIVGLREVLESSQFKKRKTNLTVCLGKDVAGRPWITDLGKAPHMLVAGATGSGKTVCLNSIIISLLFQNGPDELKLMLVDPKRVELPVYNGIPHLLTPAITEIPKTINALKWAIGEMDRRFELLSKSGRRDIDSYNEHADERLPYLVIVVDELADLMTAAAAEVEAAIIRLAQMARAVGIHLVVATQRPSVDVITGLIKANITTRIAFSVASSTDSRTIIDMQGAEKLVGRGDMLFLSSDLSKPKRIQCCYVGDRDIKKVVGHITDRLEVPVDYEEGITEKGHGADHGFGFGDDGDDELYDEAKETVVRAGKASASYLQRRLKVGYARAARLLDLLEERGIIGPGHGAKPREILVSALAEEDLEGPYEED
ncbi:hypothetical protein AMJ57_00765 [Parcubacteria bacterium SG8_24]|nr:MAG: hypothetical protein AMJ57_00765 [Parcubacteria bacterium SG8_24]